MIEIHRIISGGQTGADLSALDFALMNGIPHGGWCPQGRRSEFGAIPDLYLLKETPSKGYQQRTIWNIRDSDGTVLFTVEKKLTGGSGLTYNSARTQKKPLLHLFEGMGDEYAAKLLRDFLTINKIKTLNVAGPRQSKAPNIRFFVFRILRMVILPWVKTAA